MARKASTVQGPEEWAACLAALDPEAPRDYRHLAATLAADWARSRPRRVGLSGGQGAGKSTLSRLIEAACAHFGLRVAVLSLDDFYLTHAERRALAARVHPLFETRGPPGTHDVARCRDTIERLLRAGEVAIPRFDKGLDDRDGETTLSGPFDFVLLEGWCVGAEAESAESLAVPFNALERDEDPESVWRRHVNERLADEYADLWSALDEIVFLRVPDLDAVRRWRLDQEAARPPAQRKSAAEIARFVEYYDRITRRMLAAMPTRADRVVELDAEHGVVGLVEGTR